MSKKTKAMKTSKGIASTPEGVTLAKKNAKILADAFAAVGIATYVYEENPCWEESVRDHRPRTITVVSLPQLHDYEYGEPREFCFGHDTGKPILSA